MPRDLRFLGLPEVDRSQGSVELDRHPGLLCVPLLPMQLRTFRLRS